MLTPLRDALWRVHLLATLSLVRAPDHYNWVTVLWIRKFVEYKIFSVAIFPLHITGTSHERHDVSNRRLFLLLVNQFIYTNNKGNIKALNICPFARGIHPHKGPELQNAFQRLHGTLWSSFVIYALRILFYNWNVIDYFLSHFDDSFFIQKPVNYQTVSFIPVKYRHIIARIHWASCSGPCRDLDKEISLLISQQSMLSVNPIAGPWTLQNIHITWAELTKYAEYSVATKIVMMWWY